MSLAKNAPPYRAELREDMSKLAVEYAPATSVLMTLTITAFPVPPSVPLISNTGLVPDAPVAVTFITGVLDEPELNRSISVRDSLPVLSAAVPLPIANEAA